jgi:hypothetical protein
LNFKVFKSFSYIFFFCLNKSAYVKDKIEYIYDIIIHILNKYSYVKENSDIITSYEQMKYSKTEASNINLTVETLGGTLIIPKYCELVNQPEDLNCSQKIVLVHVIFI